MPTPQNSIHSNSSVQSIDIRIYFDEGVDRQNVLEEIADSIKDILPMISAYELVWDGFNHCTPADKPLA